MFVSKRLSKALRRIHFELHSRVSQRHGSSRFPGPMTFPDIDSRTSSVTSRLADVDMYRRVPNDSRQQPPGCQANLSYDGDPRRRVSGDRRGSDGRRV